MENMKSITVKISYPTHWVVTDEDIERVIKRHFTDKFMVEQILDNQSVERTGKSPGRSL